jgi:hypothetical protein
MYHLWGLGLAQNNWNWELPDLLGTLPFKDWPLLPCVHLWIQIPHLHKCSPHVSLHYQTSGNFPLVSTPGQLNGPAQWWNAGILSALKRERLVQPAIVALRRQRQEDCMLEVSLGYLVSVCLSLTFSIPPHAAATLMCPMSTQSHEMWHLQSLNPWNVTTETEEVSF